jgi:hypothetical protein
LYKKNSCKDTPSDEVCDEDYTLRMKIYEEALEKSPRADHAAIARMKVARRAFSSVVIA